MCGRFTLRASPAEIAEFFELMRDLVEWDRPRFNIAPTQSILAVRAGSDGREAARMRWGLIPSWAKDTKLAASMINARAETVAEKPAFRAAFKRRRCLIPVSGFYEWRRDGKVRQPFRVIRTDGRPLVLAGLWSGWKDPATGEIRRSFAIITGPPNDVVRPIHDRMPVVLEDDAWPRWLDPAAGDPGELQALLLPAGGLELTAYRVGLLVNNVRFDGPDLIEPLAG